jgi:hypothetical protein
VNTSPPRIEVQVGDGLPVPLHKNDFGSIAMPRFAKPFPTQPITVTAAYDKKIRAVWKKVVDETIRETGRG